MTIHLTKATKEVLEHLLSINKEKDARELAKELNIDYIVLMSAINELKDNKLANFEEKEVFQVSLNNEGTDYLKNGLPERQLLELMINQKIKEISIHELKEKTKFSDKIFYIGLSNMKKNRWIAQSKATGEETVFLLENDYSETEIEKFLKKFRKSESIDYKELSTKENKNIDVLNKRKLIKKRKRTQRIIYLTEKAKKLKFSNIKELEQVSKITSSMITSESWKNVKLKPFDVEKPGPLLKAGKIHPVINLINKIREIFISMGFTEIRGPIVESAFFNFDALFQPQDHPARELQDTFYLNNPKKAKLPGKANVQEVKKVHENGSDSGSTGWGYSWQTELAQKTVLRTHTTATTIRRIAQFQKNNEEVPIKVFCIDRVFRNEKVDKSHLAEFTQIEGIVINDNVTLCDLIGLLSEFYRKMGFERIITRPGFFPYTEPSMEVSVYYDKLGQWLEMGGSGIFRPEVTYPWGIREPTRVLAWGLGLERLAMLYYERSDIRDLYINPINWLREQSY